jgi:hypothetical protein
MLAALKRKFLRALSSSRQLHPRNVDKLLELGRVPFDLRRTSEQLARYKQWLMPEPLLPHQRPTWIFLMSEHSRGCQARVSEDDEDNANTTMDSVIARALPLSLLKPYPVARMERANVRPCILLTFIDRSVDLVLEHRGGCTSSERQQMYVNMVGAFNTDLIGARFADGIFPTCYKARPTRSRCDHLDRSAESSRCE